MTMTRHVTAGLDWAQFGVDAEMEQAAEQMRTAMELPIAVKGALMPDAHLGYGLPIGGVLATEGAVIPYGVGMDIACRMRMTVMRMPQGAVTAAIVQNAMCEVTRFGIGSHFEPGEQRHHEVMDDPAWDSSVVLNANKELAQAQLGSSGSGNHFIDYGEFYLAKDDLGLEAGKYAALLTHGGSRGVGYRVCQTYSAIAEDLHPEYGKLAWLDMDSWQGREYWTAMELMGRYASANHELIHDHFLAYTGAERLCFIENHHNFAWKEMVDGREAVVHRKGATPANSGEPGIIPGTMATPAYVVRGLGNKDSINSASHGAGRRMSRKQAKKELDWDYGRKVLREAEVTLLDGGGLDELPGAYKDIHQVMGEQVDLVEAIGRFTPKYVLMADNARKKKISNNT